MQCTWVLSPPSESNTRGGKYSILVMRVRQPVNKVPDFKRHLGLWLFLVIRFLPQQRPQHAINQIKPYTWQLSPQNQRNLNSIGAFLVECPSRNHRTGVFFFWLNFNKHNLNCICRIRKHINNTIMNKHKCISDLTV